MAMHSGECRCGAVAFEIAGSPILTMACHCKGCQRMTSGAFSLSALYQDYRFSKISGETVLGGLKGPTRHYFCSKCLSWIYTIPESLEGMVNIRTPMLEDAAKFPPFVDVFLAEKLPGAISGAPHGFDQSPDAEKFRELAGSYAEWDRRPD
ncbi:GFA family protein [Erythrobacter sp. GH1-10]|uniref:GFA family protein n=1 Tax=Erythrobacter sp. GH1-10 TaxID=3349334 RepID=UPI003878371B